MKVSLNTNPYTAPRFGTGHASLTSNPQPIEGPTKALFAGQPAMARRGVNPDEPFGSPECGGTTPKGWLA